MTRLNAYSSALLSFVPIAFKEPRNVNYQACVGVVQRGRRRRVDGEHNPMMEDGDTFPWRRHALFKKTLEKYNRMWSRRRVFPLKRLLLPFSRCYPRGNQRTGHKRCSFLSRYSNTQWHQSATFVNAVATLTLLSVHTRLNIPSISFLSSFSDDLSRWAKDQLMNECIGLRFRLLKIHFMIEDGTKAMTDTFKIKRRRRKRTR